MQRVLNIAHRGFTRVFPDNTLEALGAAIRLGVDGVEFDVRETFDHNFVLFHDPKLGGNDIKALTLEQIQGVRLSGGFKVPTLEEALHLCGERTKLFVELKEVESFQKLVSLLRAAVPLSSLIVLSFNRALLGELLYLAPEVPRAVLVVSPGKEPLAIMGLVQAEAIVVRYPFVNREMVDAVHTAGGAVFVWGLLSPRCVGKVVSAGVDGVITDFPDVVKKKLGGLSVSVPGDGQV